jgi:hypothetical protein
VKSSSGKSYTVKWEPRSHEVYVSGPGGTRRCSTKASSAADAMRVAEAHVYDK